MDRASMVGHSGMEGIQSFEQRSTSELSYEIDSKRNRIILANRRQPEVAWSTSKQPIRGHDNRPADRLSSSGVLGIVWHWATSCCGGGAGQLPANRANHIKSNSSLLSVSVQHIDAGPFPSNEWRTSKYTWINFLPKNLFEQFRRFANFYFLATAILQIVLPFSPVGPTTSLLPLVFVVATTSIKQAYEDYLRHKLDRELNNRPCHVLRNKKLVKVRSKDIRVGDFVYVQNNEEIPCDMILLAAGACGTGSGINNTPSDRCYVTTANLDGETSLKSRNCSQILQLLGTIRQLDQMLLVVECERPNATLYEFNGNLRAPKSAKAYDILVAAVEELAKDPAKRQLDKRKRSLISSRSQGNQERAPADVDRQKFVAQTVMNVMSKFRSKAEDPNPNPNPNPNSNQSQSQNPLRQNETNTGYHEIPLDITNILLRASRLRNTRYVYGLAVYSGRDTKLAHNSQVKPNKFSSTESTVNSFLMIAFAILMLFTVIGTIRYKLLFVPSQERATSEPFQQVFVAHFLLYNYLIPISLYVTLEFVKFFGTISVVEDKKMRALVLRSVAGSLDPSSHSKDLGSPGQPKAATGTGSDAKRPPGSGRPNRPCDYEKPRCNSSDLNEDLGQVEVLFSDKTGTLTENSMHFMACSVGGPIYRSLNERLFQEAAGSYRGPQVRVAHRMARVKANRSALIGAALSQDGGSHVTSPASASASGASGLRQPQPPQPPHRPESSASLRARGFDHRKPPPWDQLRLVDKFEQQHERVVELFICLCLCSTITINEQRPLADCLPNQLLADDHYDYRSASPDEQSLIEAAHSFGVTMCKSNDRECFIVIEKPSAGGQLSQQTGSPRDAAKSKECKPNRNWQQQQQPNQPKQQPKRHQAKFKPLVEGAHSTDRYIVRKFERLLEFEFSSLRKRMSVIIRDCDNDCLIMVTKGSEELLDCLLIDSPASESQIDTIITHFEAFSKSGLRTLLVASRVLSRAEYELIYSELKEAKLSIENREELISCTYRRAENGLSLIGATAVEDTLQEGVPATIANLKEAGIKLWLLTGDKVETAVSVAYLCKLLDRDMTVFHLVRIQDMQACQRLLASFEHRLSNYQLAELAARGARRVSWSRGRKSVKSPRMLTKSPPSSEGGRQTGSDLSRQQTEPCSSSSASASASSSSSAMDLNSDLDLDLASSGSCRFALVADGRSLHYAMKYAKAELARLCKQCSCVLGCRLSPLQKAEVVDMIKQSDESPITAAIGDGANDVSMIQEAHVGIGISGKEGRQAVNCSDFAIARFQMLNRLLFVHGHLFYHRTAHIIHYFFYKNLLFILPQFLYSSYNLSSTQSLYHPILLIGFNLLFTSLPILLYGLFEINIPERSLELYPKFYSRNQANGQLRMSLFFTWLLLATVQVLLAFYSLQMSTGLLETNKRDCINGFALILYFIIILTATIRLYFFAYSHNFYLNLSALISCLALPALLYTYSLFDLRAIIDDNSLYGQVQGYLRVPRFWFLVGTISALTVLPDLLWLVLDRVQYLKWMRSVMIHGSRQTRANNIG